MQSTTNDTPMSASPVQSRNAGHINLNLTIPQQRFLLAVRDGRRCTGAIQDAIERWQQSEMSRQSFNKLKRGLLDRSMIQSHMGQTNKIVFCSITDRGREALSAYSVADESPVRSV